MMCRIDKEAVCIDCFFMFMSFFVIVAGEANCYNTGITKDR